MMGIQLDKEKTYMDFETALQVSENKVYAKEKRSLRDVEILVFKGAWNGLSYEEMQSDAQYSLNYLKGDVGTNLWKTLSEAFGEKVGKSNLRAIIERTVDQEGSQSLALVPQALYRAKQKEYLERLITSCEDVKFAGINLNAHEDRRAARLLDIFVVPNVSEESTKSAFSPERLLLERPEKLTEREAKLWLEQRDRHAQERGRSMSAHEMLGSTRRRVVLLGSPGTGKTTLMRYLALKAARKEGTDIGLPEGQEQLPILVYMRDWAKHPERSLLDQMREFAENTLQVDLPPGFLEHWTDGHALILLDGLDEVAEDATRAMLVEKINFFLAAYENNWAVITSRPWGYRRDYFRTDTYPHFELASFNEKQIQEFIERWYENRFENKVQAQEIAQDLQDALKSKERLQNLAKNPLLLVMVALIHRYQGSLLRRLYKLYDPVIDTLLKSWDRGGKGAIYGEFKHLDRDDDLRRVLSQLAYWIHKQYEPQAMENGTLIEEADVLTQLSRIIRQEYPQVKPHQAKEEAERFLTFIRDRAGLLNEYGRGRYAFVHRTFQEYLTAEAILNQAEYEDNSELIYETIQTYLHNSHWKEVILLIVSQLQGRNAAKAIEVILRRNSPYEQWLHRDLLFAGRCLTEDPEKLATAAPETISEILQRLVNLEIEYYERIAESVKKEIFEILSCFRETAFEVEVLNYLKTSKEKINLFRLLNFQFKLGEKEVALASLLELLKDKDSNICLSAIWEFKKLGIRSEIIVNGLIDLLKDKNSFIRINAAEALEKLGDRSNILLNVLLNLLQDENSYMRPRAAETLGNLGDCSKIVVNGLLDLLKDENSIVRFRAAEALVNLGDRSKIVLNELLDLLKGEDSFVCFRAAEALVNLGHRSEILDRLLNLLQDENSYMRSRAAETLGNLGDCSKIVVNGLLDLLKDENSIVRFRAAEALVNLGDRSEIVVNELLDLFTNERSDIPSKGLFDSINDENIRSRASAALVSLGYHSEIVVNGLLDLLKGNDLTIRCRAAETLGKLGNSSEIVVKGLLNLLKDKDSFVRSRAAEALGKLGKSDPKMQSTLVQWIEQHSDLPNLGSAIDALWQTCA
jgi:HEAT repeat protein